jgi:DNA replication licensing factor MCM2
LFKIEFDTKTGLELIPHTLLRKYIAYARDHIHPKLEFSDDRISQLYADLRRESEETGSVAITIRNVESMVIQNLSLRYSVRCKYFR